jgi:hypothetical protein
MKKIIISCGLGLLMYAGWHFSHPKVVLPNGVLIGEAPNQTHIEPRLIVDTEKYQIKAVATYDVNARILSLKKYRDNHANVAPLDFVLGWQKMSSNELVNTLEINQHDHFYFWKTEKSDYPRQEIETQSANTHIIANDKLIAYQLNQLKKDSLVHLKGYLVNVVVKNTDLHWNTSLTRNDTGAGACEIMLVESVEVLN